MVTMIGVKSTSYSSGEGMGGRISAGINKRTGGYNDGNTTDDKKKNAWVAACVVHYSFPYRKPVDKKRLPERQKNYNKQAVYIKVR